MADPPRKRSRGLSSFSHTSLALYVIGFLALCCIGYDSTHVSRCAPPGWPTATCSSVNSVVLTWVEAWARTEVHWWNAWLFLWCSPAVDATRRRRPL